MNLSMRLAKNRVAGLMSQARYEDEVEDKCLVQLILESSTRARTGLI